MKLTNVRPGIYKRALEITWLAVIFLVPLFRNPQSYQIVSISKTSLLQFLVVAMLAFWVADWMLNRAGHKGLNWQDIFTSPLHLSILVFGLIAILATAASITPAISFWGSWGRKAGLLTLICWITFFLIVSQQLRTKAQLFRAIYALLLSSGIVSVVGILQHFFPNILFNLKSPDRVFSTTGNALSLSCFLAMVIPFNLALIVHSWNKITSTCHPERQRRVSKPSARLTTSQILRSLHSRFFPFTSFRVRMTGGNTEQSSHNRGKWANATMLISLVILLALQFWCLWLAQYSITILLYILAPIIFILLLSIVKRKRLMLSLGVISLLALGIIAGSLLLPLLSSTPSTETNVTEELESVPISEELGLKTLDWRVEYWKSSIDIILKSPEVPFSNDKLHFLRKFIGYGPETFVVTFQLFFPEKLRSDSTYRSELVDHPHNHYLYLATTIGLLGMISFLSILAAFFYICLRYLRRAKTDIDKLLLIAMVAAMAQYMADIFFNIPALTPELVFWLILAMTPVIGRFVWKEKLARAETEEVAQTESVETSYITRTRFLVSLGCALALIFIGTVIAVRPFLADMYLLKGLNMQKAGNEQAIYAFEKATRLDPGEAAYWHFLGGYSDSVARHVKDEPIKMEVLSVAYEAYNKALVSRCYIAYEYYFLADVCTYWTWTGTVDKWTTALSLYDEASKFFPKNAVILNKWSLALIIKGDFDEALTKLDYAASVDPDWAETSFLHGLLLAIEGKNDEAVFKLITPIQDDAANLNYFIDLCRSLASYDMLSPLKNTLEIHADEAPDDWIAHALVGITSLFYGNVDNSIYEFNAAMMLAPSNDAGDLFRAILRLSSMSEPLKTALPNVAADWKAKLIQSPERDTLLIELDKLLNTPP